jgi:hypothetical protein
MHRRRCLVVVIVAVMAACTSTPRNDAGDSLVKQLEDGGLDQRTAECVVAAFFEGKSNDELKGFFDRPELTPEEATSSPHSAGSVKHSRDALMRASTIRCDR